MLNVAVSGPDSEATLSVANTLNAGGRTIAKEPSEPVNAVAVPPGEKARSVARPEH